MICVDVSVIYGYYIRLERNKITILVFDSVCQGT